MSIKGINLGSGVWSYPNWIGYDKIHGKYLNDRTILPHKDQSIRYVYSCHFFEHINDKTIIQLLMESNRVLQKGGIIRIVVPDFKTMHERYKNNDIQFFTKKIGTNGRPEWKRHGVQNTLENILSHWFSNYDEIINNKLVYRGPPKNLNRELVRENAHTLTTEKFSEWLVSNIPKQSYVQTQHINCPTFNKMKPLLESIGFSNVKVVDHTYSKIADIKETAFDCERKRKVFSLYIEAEK